MNQIDVGVAFMFLMGGFMFVGFVVVMSILQAILEHFVKINDDKKKKEEEER